MLTIIYLAALLNTGHTWQLTRAILWSLNHDHPSVEYPRCRREHRRAYCLERWREDDRRACEYIVRTGCEKI